MDLFINETKALKHFKDVLGHANHFIITSLVGLDLLQNTEAHEISKDFHTSWNPQNKEHSIKRTRIFILKMAISRAVDALDVYINSAKKKPLLFQDESLLKHLNDEENSSSVSKKLEFICDFYDIDSKLVALINLLIVWRNKIIHSEGKNILKNEYKNILLSNSEWLTNNFCNLEVNKLLSDFDKKECRLTFKETTSLLRATHLIVQEIECGILKHLDVNTYVEELLYKNLYEEAEKNEKKVKSLIGIWGKYGDNKIKSITRKLETFGLSTYKKNNNSIKIDENLVDKIYKMNPNEMFEYIINIKNKSTTQ